MLGLNEALRTPLRISCPRKEALTRFCFRGVGVVVIGLFLWGIVAFDRYLGVYTKAYNERCRVEAEAERQRLFNAWSKLHPAPHLTREEWEVLSAHKMLPP